MVINYNNKIALNYLLKIIKLNGSLDSNILLDRMTDKHNCTWLYRYDICKFYNNSLSYIGIYLICNKFLKIYCMK